MTTLVRTVSLAAVVAVSHSTIAMAQSEPPRPPAAPPRPFQFPAVQSHTLANGLRVYVVEDHSVQVVAVRAVPAVNELSDPAGREGLTQVMLSALSEGTTNQSAAQLAAASARIGTAVAPTAFTTVTPAFEAGLALMGDMLMHPSFDSLAIERRKAAQAASYRTINSRASTPARALFYALLDGREDAVARAQNATDAGVSAITRADVVSFYEAHVGPSTISLVIVGDVRDADALAAATRVFGGWRKAATAAEPVATLPAPKPTTIYLRDVGGDATYIYAGNVGPRRDAPDAFAAEVLGTIASSRFIRALRDRRALVYSGVVSVMWKPASRPSEFFGSTTVAASKADSVLTEWIALLRSLRDPSSVTQGELTNAITSRVGVLWTKTDGPDSVATRIVDALRDDLPPNYLAQYAAGVGAVTVPAVAAAAQKYIDLDHLVIVVTGDRKVLEPVLRAANIAPVVVVDSAGRPVASQDGP